MKKFSKYKEKEVVQEETLESLVESLSIEVDSTSKVWEEDYKIKASNRFYEKLEEYIDRRCKDKILTVIEKARYSVVTKDYSWIQDEIEKLK